MLVVQDVLRVLLCCVVSQVCVLNETLSDHLGHCGSGQARMVHRAGGQWSVRELATAWHVPVMGKTFRWSDLVEVVPMSVQCVCGQASPVTGGAAARVLPASGRLLLSLQASPAT
jgi:hypothetical protein